MRYGNRRVDLYLIQGGFGHWALRTVRSLSEELMFGGHSRRMETSSHDALRKKFALVRSVTSLTGAFAGNFVDFQWDFFILQALAVV